MQENEIRKAGDYEISHAIHIGEKELVLGENLAAEDGMCYLVAYCETNGMLQRYTDCMISDNFVEVAEIFAERLQAQVQQVKEEHEQIPVPTNPIGWDQCIPMHECGDIKIKSLLSGRRCFVQSIVSQQNKFILPKVEMALKHCPVAQQFIVITFTAVSIPGLNDMTLWAY